MSVDVAALALRIESIGFDQANAALDRLEIKGKKAGGSLGGMTRTAATAGRGLGRLENAVTNVALKVAGFDGGLGRITDKLGGFALGGTVTAGLAVGLAAISLLFRQMTKETDEWVKSLDEARKAAQGLAPKTAAIVQAGVIGTRIDQLETVKARMELMRNAPGVADKIAEVERTISDLVIERGRLTEKRDKDHEKLTDEELKKQRELLALAVRQADMADRLARSERGMDAALRKTLDPRLTIGPMDQRGLTAFEQRGREPIAAPDVSAAINAALDGVKDLVFWTDKSGQVMNGTSAAFERYNDALDKQRQATMATAQTISYVAQGIVLLINSLKGNGSFWDFLAGAGGIIGTALAFTNPVAGAAVLGGSAIIGALAQPSNDGGMRGAPVPAGGGGTTYNTYYGVNDPMGQRHVTKMVRNGQARGH